MMLAIWAFAGMIALLGAGVFAELAARRPVAGGQYAYLRDGLHPFAGFEFVWTHLLIVKPASMAAAAILFAGYAIQLAAVHAPETLVAVAVLALATALNCFGVRACSTVQNLVLVFKIVGVVAVVIAGLFAPIHVTASAAPLALFPTGGLASIGAAYVLVSFAYIGWNDASAMSAEMKNAGWGIGRGLLVGVGVVVALYVLMNAACIRALGPALMLTATPASDVMNIIFGITGQRIVAVLVMASTLGLIYTKMLAFPRFTHALAEDGLFFRLIGQVNQKTRVPLAAILLQGGLAMLLSVLGSYEQIVGASTSMSALFVALTASALFFLRARDQSMSPKASDGFRMPWHPYSTAIFFVSTLAATAASMVAYTLGNTIIAAIVLVSVPFYAFWSKRKGPERAHAS